MNTAIKLILIASIASMVFLAGCVSQSTTSSANTTQQSTQPINSQNTQYYH